MKAALTGHQHLGSSIIEKRLAEALRICIDRESVTSGLTCLAAGSDQVFAQCLLQLSIPFSVTIPCQQYERTFKDPKDLIQYHHLLASASEVEMLDYELPSEQAFYQAGKRITQMCDILIAVWNGKKSKGLGGTGDIVEFAALIQKRILRIDPKTL